mmetsp:Transcript_32104/g.78009  ORF Transcript_32104/g.78009 Transcript_32104/m.78009 type:complete len:418 (+) Transcript_32104:18-1271(+)
MSNNNNNNNNNNMFGSGQDSSNNNKEIKERQEEMQVLSRFRNVISNKLEQMSTETEAEQKTYKMGDHEKKVLMQMQGMGLAEGMAAGVATFLLLRRGPIWIGRFILNRRAAGASTRGGGGPANSNTVSKNPFQNASNSANNNTMNNTGGYQLSNPFAGNTNANYNNFPRSRNPIVRGIWFLVDSTLSLMMAANVSMQYTDLKRIRKDLVELPLAEGRSLVSDAFCEELTQELQKIQHENSPAYQRLVEKYQKGHQWDNLYGGSSPSSESGEGISPLALYMEGVTLFSQNCERRAYRQRELLQEQGGAGFTGSFEDNDSDTSSSMSINDDASSTNHQQQSSASGVHHSIPIPPPGVAKDGPRLVRKLLMEGEFMEEGTDEYTVVYSNNSDNNGSGGFSSSSSSSSSSSDSDSDYWERS